MKSLTRNDTARWLAEQDRLVILTHHRPDGDTLGSAAALCLALRSMGKTAHVAENPEVTARFAGMLTGLTKPVPEAGDTVVCVDVAAPGRLPESHRHLQDRIALRIDHHATATSFTERELVDAQAASCGEMIYDVITAMGVTPDKPMAEALYVAVSTDTGCFRYPSTTAHSLRTAAACMEAGAETARLNRELFETVSFARLRMQGWMAENLRLLGGGRFALCAIPLAVEEALGVTADDMDNISGFPRTIEGVCMAATLRQNRDGQMRLSVRAVPGYDAAAVCAVFGGGGHRGAAGATLDMPLEEAADAVAAAMLRPEG